MIVVGSRIPIWRKHWSSHLTAHHISILVVPGVVAHRPSPDQNLSLALHRPVHQTHDSRHRASPLRWVSYSPFSFLPWRGLRQAGVAALPWSRYSFSPRAAVLRTGLPVALSLQWVFMLLKHCSSTCVAVEGKELTLCVTTTVCLAVKGRGHHVKVYPVSGAVTNSNGETSVRLSRHLKFQGRKENHYPAPGPLSCCHILPPRPPRDHNPPAWYADNPPAAPQYRHNEPGRSLYSLLPSAAPDP